MLHLEGPKTQTEIRYSTTKYYTHDAPNTTFMMAFGASYIMIFGHVDPQGCFETQGVQDSPSSSIIAPLYLGLSGVTMS